MNTSTVTTTEQTPSAMYKYESSSVCDCNQDETQSPNTYAALVSAFFEKALFG